MPADNTTGVATAGGHRLDPLLKPRSIALVGASVADGGFGRALLDMARGGGFDGPIHPVNPRHADDVTSGFFARLADLPETVDHVVLGVANARLEACLIEAVDHGARAVTLFADGKGMAAGGMAAGGMAAGGMAAGGMAAGGMTGGERLRAIAREAGLLLCGPNSMGFHNLDIGLRVSPFPAPPILVPGGICAILQSGSVMGALAHNDQRLRFNMLVSTGSEQVLTAADYIDWALTQPTTRVIGLFLEAVRDPAGFIAALDRADRAGMPVVVLKVGRTDLSRRMALSHTGALVGNHQVFEAVMRDRGVHQVDTVDELAAALQLFATGRPAAPGRVASLHDSGGERELLVDIAAALDVPLATFSPQTVARIQPHLDPGIVAENPLDAWASGRNAERTFSEAARAMMDDAGVAVGLYVLDWRQDYALHALHARVLRQAARETGKPLVAMTNYALTRNHDLACALADDGIALLEGTPEALRAVRLLLDHRDRHHHHCWSQPVVRPAAPPVAAGGGPFALPPPGAAGGFALLRQYGIAVPDHAVAATAADAVAAAGRLGFPVALKTAMPDIAHKTEAGGVALTLATPDAVRAAYADIAGRLGPQVIVTAMVAGGAEWSLGVVNDPDFGPVVMIGPGGIIIELLPERVVLPAPFNQETARAAILTMPAARLLTGYRGRPPLALDSLATAAAHLSMLAVDGSYAIDALDVNPVLVTDRAAVAVDVLITPRRPGPRAGHSRE